ncbi:MAG: hypothetical protein R3F62_01940 [Planctomycetota bacterium]
MSSLLIPFWARQDLPWGAAGDPKAARNHQIRELTARDDVHDRRTRTFLNRQSIPDGLIA